ncbi:hypothetical protein Q2T41_13600 [Maribacter confluentis]|uniref:O-antigen ligase family protein n=1 Tax=Maribacter confluentis TaxID=1656093 RepID=A0ABT8RS01_9FLAO|nr:hypothetical protein [Maribacter confluentis]MDO1513693.1 hypothetical protein [Maribacter confluentis]
MNSIKYFSIVEMIGTYGKLGIVLISILVFAPFVNRIGFRFTLRNVWAYWLIYLLLIFFSILYVFSYNEVGNLVYNITLVFYLFFYFFMINVLWGINFIKQKVESFEITKVEIFKVFRNALFWNLIFWFLIALINNYNFDDDFGDFGGFFQDKIHFGLFATTGFLVCFYMRYNDIERDDSKFNLIQILIYSVFAFYTSRNAILIVSVAVLYYFIIYNAKNYLYAIILSIIPFFLFYFDEIFYGISTERLNGLSSGRLEIWRITLIELFEKGIFFGNGLFNINNLVLEKNIGTGFHYLDTLEFLYFHSSWVELLAGGGVVVMLLFLWIIIKSWMYFSRIEKTVVFAILLGSTVESYLTQPFMLISILFYFVLIMNNSQMRVIKVNTTD